MSEHTDHFADASHEDQFEKEMRGYSRRQVDEFVARARSQSHDLEDRLSRALDDNERLRLELSSARQAADEKPAHAEISERVGQILKLADDEAKAQKSRAADEIAKLRNNAKMETEKLRADSKQDTEKFRADAQEQAERMLGAAQEQAENSIASARAEAQQTLTAARTEAERSVGDAHKQAETTLASAKGQAKQVLDEATARASAIHDGAERRLNLLMSRHSEALRRLTEIRDVVTGLVAGEVSRGSLEDEVAKAVASSVAAEGQQAAHAGNGNRGPGAAEGRPLPMSPGAPVPAGPAGPGGSGQQPGLGRDLEAGPAGRVRPQSAAAGRPGIGGEHRPGDLFRSTGGSRGPAAGQGPASQGPASQGPASQGPASQGPVGQGPTGQSPAGHGTVGHGPASGSLAGPDEVPPGSGPRQAVRSPSGSPRDTKSQPDSAETQPAESGAGDGAKHAAGAGPGRP